MVRFTLRSLLARKVRLVLSTLSIVLGVAFLAGVLTFSHGLSSTFDNIVKGSIPDAVVQVTGRDTVNAPQASTATLSPADLARLADLPQVAAADGGVDGYGVSLLDSSGRLVGGSGAPTFAFNHTDTRNLLGRPMAVLASGRWPRGGEVVLDTRAASLGHYRLGDLVTIITPTKDPVRHLRLVGTATFTGGGTAGAVLIMLGTREAQRLFLNGRYVFDTISLTAAPGVSQDQLAAAARPWIPHGFEVRTGDQVAADAQSSINSVLNVITTFLLVFACIAVLVGALIIVNTFTILVAQRTHELAIVRALGASRAQLTASVLLEAALTGVVATILGVAGGWALARGLAAVFRGLGLDIASDTLRLTASNVVTCVLVGVVVTAFAAYLPARRAGRIPPVAAMRVDGGASPASLRRRLYVGAPVLAVGTVLAVLGVVGAPGSNAAWIGAGAVLWIVTVATTSGLIGRPLLILLTAVFSRLFRTTGRLAGENARRDPRRTGATASALMIGLALVSVIGVLAASLNKTVDHLVDRDFAADFIVEGPAYAPYPTAVGDAMARVPGVGIMARQQIAYGKLNSRTISLSANGAGFDRIYTLDMVAGHQQARGDQAVVFDDTARDHHWRVGSRFRVRFPGGRSLHLTVVGIAKQSQVTAPISIPLGELAKVGIAREDSALSIDASPGTDLVALHQRLDRVAHALPAVSVQDKAEFAAAVRRQVNQLIYLIDGLLALAVLIATLGIVNTLTLSVIERTRELGLLRAIGVSRGQLRGMVTLESVAIAVLGSFLGLVLGLGFGVLLRQALAGQITALGLPLARLGLFLVAAVVVGVLAAVLPAIRAGRLKVLDAIAAE